MTSCLVKNSIPTKVYFWRGVVDPANLLKNEKVNQAVTKILTRDTRSSNLEKLTGHKIYSYRTSDKGRLLFKSIPLNGENVLIVLDYLPNHEYHKSKFLKPSVTKQFCDQAQYDLEGKSVNNESFTPCSFDEASELPQVKEFDEKKLEFTYATADFYGSKFIELNPTQDESLHVETPLIINGLPGSGKTCVALSAITNYVNSLPDECEKKRVLYICSKPSLADETRNNWEKLPLSKNENCRVDFLCYEDFLSKSLGISFPEKGNIPSEEISNWFTNECKRLSKKSKVNEELSEIKKENQEAIFEEFQIISTLTNIKEYFLLGNRECRFSEQKTKEVVWKFFQSYTDMLQTKGWLDKRFFKIPLEKNPALLDLIFIDEAADLAPLPYKQLIQMARNDMIIFSLDTNQDTSGSFSKRVMIKGIFRKLGKRLNSIDFLESYRCAERIVETANRCLDIKAFFRGGTSDKSEGRTIKHAGHDVTRGRIERMNRSIEEIYQIILDRGYKETDVAIISEEEDQKELRVGLTFTPDEIKGLEYRVIILDRPLDSSLFKQLNTSLNKWSEEDSKTNLHRPKKTLNDSLEITLTPKINALFTSINRAQELLVFNQDSNHNTKNILKILKVDDKSITPHVMADSQHEKASIDDWYFQAKRLWENDSFKQFDTICRTHLKQDPELVLKHLGLSPIKKENTSPPQSSKRKTEKRKDSVNSSSLSPLENRNEQKKSALKPEKPKNLTKKTNTPTSSKKKINTNLMTSSINGPKKPVKNNHQLDKKLINACSTGNIKEFKQALENGADVNATTSQDRTPLFLASSNNHKKITEMLLGNGAGVDLATFAGNTPLITSSYKGHTDIVEMLLKNGADIKAVNNQKHTALQMALLADKRETAKIILRYAQ
jgi:Ankyrin repeats (3 copies)/Ankyrin repeats (many copies)